MKMDESEFGKGVEVEILREEELNTPRFLGPPMGMWVCEGCERMCMSQALLMEGEGEETVPPRCLYEDKNAEWEVMWVARRKNTA